MTTTTENLAAALRTILAGSDHAGVWLDESGTECAEDDEGAEFREFDEEQQTAWLATVADIARAALAEYDAEQAPRQPQPLGDAPRGSL